MHTRSVLWGLLVLLLTVSAVSAADITVAQGDTLHLVGDTGVRGYVDEAGATFAIPAFDYFHNIKQDMVYNPVFQDTVVASAQPGLYTATVRLEVNAVTVQFRTLQIQVVPRGTVLNTTTNATSTKPVLTVTGPSTVMERVTIPPIPDVTPGDSIILPLTVRGDGTFDIEIPTLPFGDYEVPNPVTVHGEKLVPVLLHISPDAQPGIYAVPITVDGQQFPVRIRIIRYTTRPVWTTNLILWGIILIIIAALIALYFSTQPPRSGTMRARPPRPPMDSNQSMDKQDSENSDDPLITYY